MMKKHYQSIQEHALQAYPNECCGLIVGGVYYPCENVAHDPANLFEIDPQAFIDLSDKGELQAIVHSHPDGEPMPSEYDRVQMSLHGVPWLIASVNDGRVEIRQHEPQAYTAPLLGRDYIHGVQDCYSLCRDYYWRECGIRLNDYPRLDAWWEDPTAQSLYVDNFKAEGFFEVDPKSLQKHDAIICKVGKSHFPNHALIYIGDGELTSETTPQVIGQDLVLHHPYGRLSVREQYGQNWQRRTVMVLRHRDFLK